MTGQDHGQAQDQGQGLGHGQGPGPGQDQDHGQGQDHRHSHGQDQNHGQRVLMNNKKLTNIIESSNLKKEDSPRYYIGASSIGNECLRALWYGTTGCERSPRSAKQLRTLEIGKILESMIINCLIDAGLDIDTPNKDNDFLAVCDREILNFKGHMDAVWKGNAIIEIKTAKDSSFRIFEKNGIIKWYPVYYAQIQSYMGMSGIHKAYVIAINKDTSELHDQEVDFNEEYYESLREKVKTINSMGVVPPQKISNSPLYFGCKICDFRKICHG